MCRCIALPHYTEMGHSSLSVSWSFSKKKLLRENMARETNNERMHDCEGQEENLNEEKVSCVFQWECIVQWMFAAASDRRDFHNIKTNANYGQLLSVNRSFNQLPAMRLPPAWTSRMRTYPQINALSPTQYMTRIMYREMIIDWKYRKCTNNHPDKN